MGRKPSSSTARNHLTKREIDVLALLATGMSSKEVADKLFMSQATVNTHCCGCFEVLGVHNRIHAIFVAAKKGFLDIKDLASDDMAIPAGVSRLTKRELDTIYALFVHGNSTATAKALRISKRTVDYHLASIYEKLQVRSRTGLLRIAFAIGYAQRQNEKQEVAKLGARTLELAEAIET